MSFRVGQKVTMKKPVAWASTYNETLPKFGTVYTVRALNHYEGAAFILLREIRNPICAYSDMTGEMDFAAWCFRPVVERKTSIEIFTAMLKPQGVDA